MALRGSGRFVTCEGWFPLNHAGLLLVPGKSLRCDPCGVIEEKLEVVSTNLAAFWEVQEVPVGRDLYRSALSRHAVIESLLCAICSGVFIVLLLYAVLYLLSTCCMQALTQFYPQYEQRSGARRHKQASQGCCSAASL